MNAVRSMQQSVRFSTAPGQHRVLLRAPRVLGLTSRTAIKSKVATVEPAAPLVDDRGFQLKQVKGLTCLPRVPPGARPLPP